jgi:RND family efflux transporter MFP subunit
MSLEDLKKSSSSDPVGSPEKRKRSYSWLFPVGLILGFLGVFALLFSNRLIPALPVKTAPVVTIRSGDVVSQAEDDGRDTVLPVLKGKGQLLFQASGWVEPEPYPFFASTLINGVVDEVHVLEGQAVKKDELLATLIDEDARLDLKTAQRNYESHQRNIAAHCAGFEIIDAETTSARRKIEAIETQVAEARDTLSRLNKLSSGAVSQLDLVQARMALERQVALLAEAQSKIPNLEAKKAQLMSQEGAMRAELETLATARDRAQLALDRTRITSPINGIVLQLHAAPGMKRMLAMDSPTSATIAELYDPDNLQARIDVALNEASALFVGQPVDLVSDLLPDQVFTGTVTRITGQADLQRNTLQVKVKIHDPDHRMRPEMLVRAKFFARPLSKEHSQGSLPGSSGRLALYVPENALVSETQVWVVSPESKATLRTIKLGQDVRDDHRLVIEGLRSGESVILPPHDQLGEGSRVETKNQSH